ncbi:MAG: 1-acyl-sn-glycerol-3-phosphate acyltransferase [Spirulinaceae cyanobacterium RM2_2_10]|nr:1-acyl-sn-glycerol-3-phosphate acyltransferase [Spirulinaceae cyanobacterium SM2_1_0]NJO21599.1 1-acyl-sn-glycerol-3-phosphate acyltransferase [Spirulinaceae cyanobacterium RM2_2_10]
MTSSSDITISSRISPWLGRLVYPLGSYALLPLYFGRIDISGQENIPRCGPTILAPTHRSRWDAIIVPHATGRLVSGRYLRFMVSADEMCGLQGWFIRRLGGFPVNPQSPGLESLRHTVELLCQGEMLTIFPEGNIFRQPTVSPLKRGVAVAALQAQAKLKQQTVKIVPISLHYSDEYPRWGSNARVDIGEPIDAIDYYHGSLKRDSKHLTADLELALKALHEVERQNNQALASVA